MRKPRPYFALLLLAALPAAAQPIGTAFTYQGRLTDGATPPNANYDFEFLLFDQASGGAQQGPTVIRNAVVVADGLFTVSLDFGAVFAGAKRWLEVRVRPAGGGAFTTLSPRQDLTPSPNAVFSSVVPWTGVSGKPAGFADDIDNDSGGDITGVAASTGLSGGGTSGDVTLSVNPVTVQSRVNGNCPAGQSIRVVNQDGTVTCEADNDSGGDITEVFAQTGPIGSGTSSAVALSVDPVLAPSRVAGIWLPGQSIRVISQTGAVTCEVDDDTPGWGLTGNAGTAPGTNFIGTTDSQPLEFRAGNQRALRLEWVTTNISVIAGYPTN